MRTTRHVLMGWFAASAAALGQGAPSQFAVDQPPAPVVAPSGTVSAEYLPLPDLPIFKQVQASAPAPMPMPTPLPAPGPVVQPAPISVLPPGADVVVPTSMYWGSLDYIGWQVKGQSVP